MRAKNDQVAEVVDCRSPIAEQQMEEVGGSGGNP